MNSFRKSVAVALLGGGAVGGLLLGTNIVREAQWARAEQKVENTREQLATITDLSSVFRNVGKAVEPSVVNIQVRKTVKGVKRQLPFDDNLLKRFFPIDSAISPMQRRPMRLTPRRIPTPLPTKGKAATIWNRSAPAAASSWKSDGKTAYILTNNHVAGGATEMPVTLADGRRIENAKVLGTDPKSDLAVVQIEAGSPHRRQVGRQRRTGQGRLDPRVRKPVRLRRIDDPRHRQRLGPPGWHPRKPGVRRFHPGRCPDQSRQQRWSAGEHPW